MYIPDSKKKYKSIKNQCNGKKTKNLKKNYSSDKSEESSFTTETNSQTSENSYLDLNDYGNNLIWHKLDFELEFGDKTNKMKNKFLNYEI